jgi:hypothetical protein
MKRRHSGHHGLSPRVPHYVSPSEASSSSSDVTLEIRKLRCVKLLMAVAHKKIDGTEVQEE